MLLAGDALSLINPLTGEGIFYALLSGRLAGAAAVGDGDAGAAYAAALRGRARPPPAPHHAAGPADRPAGARRRRRARRRARSPRAMDALVELGLGRGLITPALAGGLVRQLLPG